MASYFIQLLEVPEVEMYTGWYVPVKTQTRSPALVTLAA
jgi:hypothetical protein